MADTFTDAIEQRSKGNPVFSQEGLDLVRTFEGFRPDAYYDLDNKKKLGKLTVGYGFTDNDIPDLKPGFRIDKAAAEKMLPDLINRKYAPTVLEKVKTPLNDQQFSALTSFVYNVGPGNFESSTLLKKLNSGDYAGAAGEFKRWNKAGGKTMEGLVKRRRAEEALFKGETDALGSILESQKFGVSEDYVPPSGEKFGVSEAITPEPDLPNLPNEPELTPEQEGAKVAEDIANGIEATPEDRGAEAAKKIAKSIEEGAENQTKAVAGEEEVFDFKEFAKGLGKTKKEQKEEDLGIPFADASNFKTSLPSLASGLPRVSSGLASNPGLGNRKIKLGKNLSLGRRPA